MMIHLIDQDTKETFKSFDDNEVQAAIAAARASGKVVNMELDDENRHCLIYIMKQANMKTGGKVNELCNGR